MVKVVVDFDEVIRGVSQQNRVKARKIMSNQMIIDMDKFIPYKDGDLRGSVGLSDEGETIEYRTKYAKAQFYGGTKNPPRTFRNYTTKGTGKRWDLKAKGIYLGEWKEIYKKGLKL